MPVWVHRHVGHPGSGLFARHGRAGGEQLLVLQFGLEFSFCVLSTFFMFQSLDVSACELGANGAEKLATAIPECK